MEENVYCPPTKIPKLDRAAKNKAKILRNCLIRSRVSASDWKRFQKKENLKRVQTKTQSLPAKSKPIYDAKDWPGENEQIEQTARVDAGSQMKPFSDNSNIPNNTRNPPNNNLSRLGIPSLKRNYSSGLTTPYIQGKEWTATPTSSATCMNRTSVTNIPLYQQDKRYTQPSLHEFVDRESTSPLSSALQETVRKLSSKSNTSTASLFESPFSHNNEKPSSCVKPSQKFTQVEPVRLKIIRTRSGQEIPLCDCKRGVSENDLKQQNRYLSAETITGECENIPSCASACLESEEPNHQKTTKSSQAINLFGNETSRFNSAFSGDGYDRNASDIASEIITGESDTGRGRSSKDVGELEHDDDTFLDDDQSSDEVPHAGKRGDPGYSETCPANLGLSPQCRTGCYFPDRPPWDDGHGPTDALIKKRSLAAIRAYRSKEYSDSVRERNKVTPIRPECPDSEESPPRSCGGTTRHNMSCRAYTEFLSMLARQVIDFHSQTSVNALRQSGGKSIPESEIQSEILKESIQESDFQSESLNGSITLRTTPTRKCRAVKKKVVRNNPAQKIAVICCSADESCCDSISSINRRKKSVGRNAKNKANKITKTFRRKDISYRNVGKNQSSQLRKLPKGKKFLYPTYHLTRIVPVRYIRKNRKGELDSGSEEFVSDSWNESYSNSSSEDLEPKQLPNKKVLNKGQSRIYKRPLRDFSDPRLHFATNMYYMSNDKYPGTDSSQSTEHSVPRLPQKYFSYEKQVNTEFKGSSESLLIKMGDNKNHIPIKISVSSETSFRRRRRRYRKNQTHANINCKEVDNCLRNITRSRKTFFRDKNDINSSNFLIDGKIFPRMNSSQQTFQEPSKLRTLSQSMKIEIQQNNTDSESLRQNSSDNYPLKESPFSHFITDICDKSCMNQEQKFLTYYTDDVQTSTSDLPPFTFTSSGNTSKLSKKYIDVATSNTDLLDSRRELDNLLLKHNFQERKNLIPQLENKSCTADIGSHSMISSVHSNQQNMFKHYSFYTPSSNVTNRLACGYRTNEGKLKFEDRVCKATNRGPTKLVLAMDTSMDIACVQTDPSRSDDESTEIRRDLGTQTHIRKPMTIEQPKISKLMTRMNYEEPKNFRDMNYPHGKYIEKTKNCSKTNPVKMCDERLAMCNDSRTQKYILETQKPYSREKNEDLLDPNSKLIFKKMNPGEKIGIHSNKKFEDMVSLKTFINKQTRSHLSGVFETESSGVKTAGAHEPSNCNKNTKNKVYCNETSVIKQNLHHNPLKLLRTNPYFSTMYGNNRGKRLINLLPRIKISQNTKFEQPLCSVLPENARKGKRRIGHKLSVNLCSSPHTCVSPIKMDVAHLHEQTDSKIGLGKETQTDEKNSNPMTQHEPSSYVNHESIHNISKSISSRTFQKRHERRLVFQKSRPRKSHEIMIVKESPKRRQITRHH